jgi:peptide chain release factor subunit 1
MIFMAKKIQEVSQAELVVFKKKLAKLAQYKGRGTELISVYIPPATDRSAVMSQLNEEISQSSNIKSPSTKKNVQGALRKIINFLKQINFKIPDNGLVVFAGNVSETEGRTDIRLFTMKPVKELRTKLYWCDSQFHLDPLKEMATPQEVYGLIVIDKNEATIAVLIGKRYDIVGHFTSNVAGKTRAGGQSSVRFERLREEAAQEFYKRVSEKSNDIFIPLEANLKGLLIGGPGMTKTYFLEKDLINHNLKKRIIGTIDTSYTDESGIVEMVQRSEEILKDTAMMKERVLVNKFFSEAAKNGLAIYGEKHIMESLEIGKVDKVLLSESINWTVFKFICESCSTPKTVIVRKLKYSPGDEKCDVCMKEQMEIVEEVDYIDYMIEKAAETGASVDVISTDTAEGSQFSKTFDGMGALLRFK